MNIKKLIGLDYYKINITTIELITYINSNKISIYELKEYNNYIGFYANIKDRNKLKQLNNIISIKSIGTIGYLFHTFIHIDILIAISTAIILYIFISNNTIYIDIVGEDTNTKNAIVSTLNNLNYKVPFLKEDPLVIKDLLKDNLKNNINWLEISNIGSCLKISYTPKYIVNKNINTNNNIIATKDGVIASFDIIRGNKLVKINDYVKKGDILVSNTVIDSMNISESIDVNGKVYAYTWYTINVEIDEKSSIDAFDYYKLLFEARRTIAKEIGDGEKIIKENVLHFEPKVGKMNMQVHYTLLEVIGTS